MRKLLAAAVLAFGVMCGAAYAGVSPGEPAPEYVFEDIEGINRSISSFKGKVVVLEWTNPGCPFVKKFYDAKEMQRVQTEALKDTNVVWFSINSSGPGKEGHMDTAAARKWVSDMGARPTGYVLDENGKFGKLFGAKTTPHIFIIDKEGKIAYQGAIDSIKSADADDIAKADNHVLKTLAALKDGKAVEPASTEPYGCGVKYAE